MEASGPIEPMTLEHAERFNGLLREAMGLGSETVKLLDQSWIPKYLRRSGLSLYWAWAYEFTLPELIALMSYVTGTDGSLSHALYQPNVNEALLDWKEEIESDTPSQKVKRRSVILILTMLYAIQHSLLAIGFHSLSIDELMKKGLEGDMLALKRAVAIDPTVLSAPSVAAKISELTLRGRRKELSKIYSAAAKGPNKKLKPNWELRYMERILEEGKVIQNHGREATFKLFTERLKLYDPRGGDAYKGLFTLFGRWREDATT